MAAVNCAAGAAEPLEHAAHRDRECPVPAIRRLGGLGRLSTHRATHRHFSAPTVVGSTGVVSLLEWSDDACAEPPSSDDARISARASSFFPEAHQTVYARAPPTPRAGHQALPERLLQARNLRPSL